MGIGLQFFLQRFNVYTDRTAILLHVCVYTYGNRNGMCALYGNWTAILLYVCTVWELDCNIAICIQYGNRNCI